jgi:hypothetical protein
VVEEFFFAIKIASQGTGTKGTMRRQFNREHEFKTVTGSYRIRLTQNFERYRDL